MLYNFEAEESPPKLHWDEIFEKVRLFFCSWIDYDPPWIVAPSQRRRANYFGEHLEFPRIRPVQNLIAIN